jgi:hypothetical protein
VQDIPSEWTHPSCTTGTGHAPRACTRWTSRRARGSRGRSAPSVPSSIPCITRPCGRVAPSLATVARAPDGLVEGVEWPTDDWWMVGVQWHP